MAVACASIFTRASTDFSIDCDEGSFAWSRADSEAYAKVVAKAYGEAVAEVRGDTGNSAVAESYVLVIEVRTGSLFVGAFSFELC